MNWYTRRRKRKVLGLQSKMVNKAIEVGGYGALFAQKINDVPINGRWCQIIDMCQQTFKNLFLERTKFCVR